MKKRILTSLAILLLFGCSSIKLEPVDFSWPIENVLEIRSDFNVASMRYAITLNLRDLFEKEEMIKDNSPVVKKVRIIRNRDGYYFITANKFKHVYVFKPEEKSLVLVNTITINEKGMNNPAFNQRDDYIELVTNGGKKKFKITQNGIIN